MCPAVSPLPSQAKRSAAASCASMRSGTWPQSLMVDGLGHGFEAAESAHATVAASHERLSSPPVAWPA